MSSTVSVPVGLEATLVLPPQPERYTNPQLSTKNAVGERLGLPEPVPTTVLQSKLFRSLANLATSIPDSGVPYAAFWIQ